MIRVCLVGDFWNRQPLAYAPIRDRLAGTIEFVDDARDAQLALFSHTHDLTNHAKALCYMAAAHPKLQLVLLSEEPFWDTCWAPDPFAKYQTWSRGPSPFRYTVLNHTTSDIFDTQAIPYYLLTDPRFIARYQPYLERNAGISASDWLARWRRVTWDAAFVAERRESNRHAPGFPSREVWGLSVLRGVITRDCEGANILRTGKGWDCEVRRNELADWHAEKLARLDLKCRYVSALENTHQTNYVTEKIFDAYAVGGVPLYIATKTHAVNTCVGTDSWINLVSHLPRKDAVKAPPFDAGAPVNADIAGAYVETQNRLAQLFSAPATVEDELDQLATRLFDALHRLTV